MRECMCTTVMLNWLEKLVKVFTTVPFKVIIIGIGEFDHIKLKKKKKKGIVLMLVLHSLKQLRSDL